MKKNKQLGRSPTNSVLGTKSYSPLRNAPFAPWPYFEREEIDATVEVLNSGKVNSWTGEEGKLFEKEFSEYIGTNYAIALANGTVALELALYALGIGPGDEVITTSRSFIASASSVVLRGAKPVFADVDPVSQNITAESIKKVLSPASKAIIAVHLAGWPCDMDSVIKLARDHDLRVIEDCAQAHGATYKGRKVGSFGDIAAFSFCQDKIITTGGEGGLFATNDAEFWQRAWSYKEHGKSFDAVFHEKHKQGFRWLHQSFGTNWRLTEMQAAIGRSALRKLPRWIDIRRRNAAVLTMEFSNEPLLRVTVPPSEIGHAYYKYYTFLKTDLLKPDWDRDRVVSEINAEGVPCFSGSCSEIYLEKAFVQAGLGPEQRLPVAKDLGGSSLMFLVHPTLDVKDMKDTCLAVRTVLGKASAAKTS